MPGSTTDTVPTMLTPGEFVIKRESAKMLGKPFLEQLNAVSDNSAHSNIDALISQAALAQMQPMEGGGVVNEYMGGGDVSNYMGGGDVMNYRYGGGVMEKKKMAGYQDGGAVSDNTATSAMDALIAQAKIAELQKKNPLSNYSMVDADKVDAENQEILNSIIDSVMPGGAIGSIKQTGKLAPLAKKFASLAPDKGKQKVLDKIASEMSVAPSRKVMQNPSRNLYDYKDYKVLEKKPESFDAMDLINKGYLQKYTNKLVRNMNPSGSVKLGDIVDADYASNMRGGYYNINDMAEGVIKMPKKERIKAAKDLLKYFNINLRNVKGKQDGGEIVEDQVLPDWSKIRPGGLLKLFKEKYQQTFPTELEASIYDRGNFVYDSLEQAGLDDTSYKFDDEYSKAMGGMNEFDYDDARSFLQDMAAKRPREITDAERAETDSVLSALTPAIARLYSENPDIFKSPPKGTTRKRGDLEAQRYDTELPLTDKYERWIKSTFKNALPGFYPTKKQDGGEVNSLLPSANPENFEYSSDEFNQKRLDGLLNFIAQENANAYLSGDPSQYPMEIKLSPEEDKFRNNPNPDKPFGNTVLDDLLLRAFEKYMFGTVPSMKD